jgi:hypothetical protein
VILASRFAAAWQWLMPAGDEDPAKAFATPRVTLPQKLALGQAVVAVLIVLGFSPDTETQQLIIGLSALVAAALSGSDAAIRRNRSEFAERIAAASSQQQASVGGTQKKAGGAGALTISDDDRAAIVDGLLQR